MGSNRPRDIKNRAAAKLRKELERENIVEVLKEFGGNKTKSAKKLRIAKTSLHLKIHRYKISKFEYEKTDRPFREDPRLLVRFSE